MEGVGGGYFFSSIGLSLSGMVEEETMKNPTCCVCMAEAGCTGTASEKIPIICQGISVRRPSNKQK